MAFLRGLFFFLWVFLLVSGAAAQSSEQKFRPFFLCKEADATQLSQSLNLLGGDRIFSPWTSRVEVADFTGLDLVPVDQIRRRLTEEDPRWTPWLRNVADVFESSYRGNSGSLILVPSDAAVPELLRALEEAGAVEMVSPAEGTKVPGPLMGLFALGVYGLWGGLWWLRLSRHRKFHGVVFACGLGAVIFSPLLLVPVMGFQVMVLQGRQHIRDHLRRRAGGADSDLSSVLVKAGILGAGMATLGLTVFPDGVWWTGFLFLGVISGVAALAYWKYREKESRLQEHRFFEPLSLRTAPPRRRQFWISTGLLVLPFLALGVTSLPQSTSVDLVSPGERALPDFSLDTENLRQKEESSGIPGPASWLAHRIFQETFVFYPWKGSLELPPEPVVLPSFLRRGDRFLQVTTEVLHLDRDWLGGLSGGLSENHPVSLPVQGAGPGIQGASWQGLLTLGLLYFFLLLVRWFPAPGQERSSVAVETRRDSVA